MSSPRVPAPVAPRVSCVPSPILRPQRLARPGLLARSAVLGGFLATLVVAVAPTQAQRPTVQPLCFRFDDDPSHGFRSDGLGAYCNEERGIEAWHLTSGRASLNPGDSDRWGPYRSFWISFEDCIDDPGMPPCVPPLVAGPVDAVVWILKWRWAPDGSSFLGTINIKDIPIGSTEYLVLRANNLGGDSTVSWGPQGLCDPDGCGLNTVGGLTHTITGTVLDEGTADERRVEPGVLVDASDPAAGVFMPVSLPVPVTRVDEDTWVAEATGDRSTACVRGAGVSGYYRIPTAIVIDGEEGLPTDPVRRLPAPVSGTGGDRRR